MAGDGLAREDLYDPERTYALVVGVSRYRSESSEWSNAYRPGVDAEAVRFARWLCGSGVPAENIILMLSETAEEPLPVGLKVRPGPTGESLGRALKELETLAGEVLFFYWAGHGFIHENGQRLLTANADSDVPRNISLPALMTRLAGLSYQTFRRQMFIVDACREVVIDLVPDPEALPKASAPVVDIEQSVIFGTPPGQPALHSNVRQRTSFSLALFPVLEGMAIEAVLSDPDLVIERVNAEASLNEKTKIAGTVVLFAHGPHGEMKRWESKGRLAYPLVAVVPRVGGVVPEVACVRLDVAWGLVRDPVRAVLVDHRDADLSVDLTVVEDRIVSEAAEQLSPRKVWRSSPVDMALMSPAGSTNDDVAQSWVLRFDIAGPYQEGSAQLSPAALEQIARMSRDPRADIVLQVTAQLPVDGLRAAEDLARILPPIDGGKRWPVFGRVTPSLPGTRSAEMKPTDQLIGVLRERAVVRGLDWPEWSVDDLGELGSGKSADSAAHLSFLRLVRDLAPEHYPGILRKYARHATGAPWQASVQAAADYDETLDTWLLAVQDAAKPAGPDDFGPVDVSVADALCLAHYRRGDLATALRWAERGVSPGVRGLCRWRKHVLERPEVALGLAELAGMDWRVGPIAARANQPIDLSGTDLDRAGWRSTGVWSAIASQPVDVATLELFRRLPDAQQPLWGLIHERTVDGSVDEEIDHLRRLIRYVATGGERRND